MYKNRGLKIIAWSVIGFLILPLLLVSLTAFNTTPVISMNMKGFTLEWFEKAFESRSLMSSLKNSLILASVSALLGIVIGLFTSVALVKKRNRLSSSLLSFFLSPSLIPGIVIGYVLYRTLILQVKMPMVWALVLGHLLIVLPYCIRVISAALRDMDESVEEAARSLGCTPIGAFIRVVLPNLKSAIPAAFILSFINSFNNIPVSMYLKGPGFNTLPYAMMNHIEYNYDPTVSALSVTLMAFTLVVMILIDKTLGLGNMSK